MEDLPVSILSLVSVETMGEGAVDGTWDQRSEKPHVAVLHDELAVTTDSNSHHADGASADKVHALQVGWLVAVDGEGGAWEDAVQLGALS